ncbi:MAG: hypothetical protein ABSD85_10400 [Acidimicrobiales bacterium]
MGKQLRLDLALQTATTVTALLEQLVGEPVDAHDRLHTSVRATVPNHLDVAEGHLLLWRSALLRGRRSALPFMRAASLIVPSRLPVDVCARLEASSDPIGRILAEEGIDFIRSPLPASGRSGPSPAGTSLTAPEHLLTRTYRLDLGDVPVMVITEWFLQTLEPFLGSLRSGRRA